MVRARRWARGGGCAAIAGDGGGAHDKDGDEEVAEEEERVEVARRVVEDPAMSPTGSHPDGVPWGWWCDILVDIKVAKEGAAKREDGGDVGVVPVHCVAELHVEHHREGEH